MTSTPLLPDPYESEMVEVRHSKVPGANDGLFARKKIESDTVLAFYNGQRIMPKVRSTRIIFTYVYLYQIRVLVVCNFYVAFIEASVFSSFLT